ncbi:MAG: GGDEF domain-containing protein [Campylobacteraceae bacterium]|nr:GGDEF domain-containing protein [Campylobacteraceae bacterium]
MYQEMFKEIKHLNTKDLTHLEKTNLKLEQIKELNEAYLPIYELFLKNYDIKDLSIKIQDSVRGNYIIHLKSENYDFSKRSIKFDFTINQSANITFDFYLKSLSITRVSAELFKTLETLSYFLSKELYTIYLNENISQLKLIDNITGLYNRKYLTQHLEKMLPLAKREKSTYAFLLIRIDRYKAVIDEFNYEIGEKLLIALSKLLIKNVRNSDIVIKLERDEFLIVLPNIHTSENANFVANKLVAKFANFEFVLKKKENIILKKSICISITLFPETSETIEDIYKHLDIALHEANNKGRSIVLEYTNSISSSIDLF